MLSVNAYVSVPQLAKKSRSTPLRVVPIRSTKSMTAPLDKHQRKNDLLLLPASENQRTGLTLYLSFSLKTPVPRTNLWEKPPSDQCAGKEVLEVPDDSPNDEPLSHGKTLEKGVQGKVDLSADPISDCSAEPRRGKENSQPQDIPTGRDSIFTEELPNRPNERNHHGAGSYVEKKSVGTTFTSPGKKLKVMTKKDILEGVANTADERPEISKTPQELPETKPGVNV